MKKELHARGTDVDESTICRFLKQFFFSRKKMRLVAIQCSEELRARYLSEVVLYNPNMLVFADETGSNRKDAMRKFGDSLRGQRCIAKKLLEVMFVNGCDNIYFPLMAPIPIVLLY